MVSIPHWLFAGAQWLCPVFVAHPGSLAGALPHLSGSLALDVHIRPTNTAENGTLGFYRSASARLKWLISNSGIRSLTCLSCSLEGWREAVDRLDIKQLLACPGLKLLSSCQLCYQALVWFLHLQFSYTWVASFLQWQKSSRMIADDAQTTAIFSSLNARAAYLVGISTR